MDGAERDLRRIEKLAAFRFGNGADEDAVSQTCNEVADVFVSGQKRHSVAIRRARLVGREYLVRAGATALLHVSVVGAPPGGAATLDRFFMGWIGFEAGGRCRLRCWGGFGQAEFGIGCIGHRWILPCG